MEEFYVRKELLTDWLQQKICVLLQCKYCWYVWGIWGQQRGSELALLLCHHFVFWTGKIILLSIFPPFFSLNYKSLKPVTRREKNFEYTFQKWQFRKKNLHLFIYFFVYVNSPSSISVAHSFFSFFQIRSVLSGDFPGLACFCRAEALEGNWC